MATSFEKIQAEAALRWQSLTSGHLPWIRIGTALCGKAAGSDQAIAAIHAELKQRHIQATVSEVGCLGLCYAEPLVDISMPNGPRTFYHNVTPNKVPSIIYSHLGRREPTADLALGYLGEARSNGTDNLSDHPMMRSQSRIALRNAGTIDPCDIYARS